jgi:hypothetical protein
VVGGRLQHHVVDGGHVLNAGAAWALARPWARIASSSWLVHEFAPDTNAADCKMAVAGLVLDLFTVHRRPAKGNATQTGG